MSIKEIATGLVALCNEGKNMEAMEAYYGADIISNEPMPGEMQKVQGMAAVKAKAEWWSGAHEIHSEKAEGPWYNGDQFTVKFIMDVTQRASGQRFTMEEVALYTVADGKIVEESFFYDMGQ